MLQTVSRILKENKMYLKKITRILIIAIIVSFSIRTFGTVFPQVFQNMYMVKTTILINTIFIISHLLFWLVFYKEYAYSRSPLFKKACTLAIIGSVAVSILYIKKLPFVFNAQATFPLLLMSPYVDAFTPLICSVFHLIFFVVFKKSLEAREKEVLRKPILSIIFGISFFICFHMIVLFNFLTTHTFKWIEHMPRLIAVGTTPMFIIAVLLMLAFYYKFYLFLDSNNKMRDT
jgi:hypothetical protein